MKRNQIYVLLLVILGIAVYVLVFRKPASTLNEAEKSFAVEDTAAIFRIFMADMEGRKVVLERENDGWMVNKKYEVRNDYMKSLLSTIKRLNVSHPVPEAAQKTVITALASTNKKVELYDQQGNLLKSYFVGGGTLNSTGTYFLMEGATQPYVVSVPAFEGVLDSRFVTDEETIRSTELFRFRINQISSVSVSYPDQPDSSFSIQVYNTDSFTVQNGNAVEMQQSKLNKQRVQDYLSLYSAIYCESFVNNLSKRDSILQTHPFCTITLTDRQKNQYTVVCYRMPRNSTSEQYDAQGNELLFDTDRFYATINNGKDFVILQQFHFGRIMKNYHYFTIKPAV